MQIDDVIKKISRGTTEIINVEALQQKLHKSFKDKEPLRIKAGFDPTAPDIHLGHVVLLRKLRQFQDLGHKVIFLIGDATALVGDPSGQSVTRKTMTWNEVTKNAQTYVHQVSKILNTANKKIFEIEYNSRWFSRHGHREQDFPPFTFETFVELASKYTIARILERGDFQKRIKENKPISYLETFYPLMQGYDSVMLKADVELGGTDQKFNLLVGRELQREYGQEPQVVITTPLLEGLDGTQKMSKSLGNHIGINEPPKEMFGKIMSLSDELMWKYYEFLTQVDLAGVRSLHPKEAKLRLAEEIVGWFHSGIEAARAREDFEKTFSQKQIPEDTATYVLRQNNPESLMDILVSAHLAGSKNEARRLLKQGAVSCDGQKILDEHWPLTEGVLKVGKRRFLKLLRKS